MINKAIAKITDEMMQLDDPFATFIEEYLTSICTTEAVAEKLLDPKKSLKEFTRNVTAEFKAKAAEKKQAEVAIGAPDEYFYERVREYFEIDHKMQKEKREKIDILDLM